MEYEAIGQANQASKPVKRVTPEQIEHAAEELSKFDDIITFESTAEEALKAVQIAKDNAERIRQQNAEAVERNKEARNRLKAANEEEIRGADWAQNWYLVTGIDKIVRPGELKPYSSFAFNTLFAQNLPLGAKGTPFNYVRDLVGFKEAENFAYAAGYPGVFEFGGRTFINSYRPDSAPVEADEYTFEGLAAVETIRTHLRTLFADENTARMIETWIALNVRHPGKLLRIAPLIKGTEGDGKTIIFSKMMRAIMGAGNVSEVALNELGKDFNAWAGGAAIRVFEEIKASGRNRYSVLDSLKTAIANDSVTVVKKGVDGAEIPNSTNYIALTNHEDALPISDSDRRWWILFTPFKNGADIQRAVGDIKRYFDRVADAIQNHADALRKYFLECDLHPEITHDMRAPITEWRGRMMKAEVSSLGGDYLDSYIEQGNVNGVRANVIVTDEMAAALERDMGKADMPQGKQLARLLSGRGYHACDRVIYWEKKTRRVYVKNPSLVNVRENLDTIKGLLKDASSF